MSGIVQGVGFRPLVYRLALEHGLRGYVCNEMGMVTVDAEGPAGQVARFREELLRCAKPPARIDEVAEDSLPPAGYSEFSIRPSVGDGPCAPVFPPDLAICGQCQADLTDPASRFFRYPFTSCTYCGPRYAVIEGLPYDRPLTSMAGFALCEACRAEYTDPANRRFHAQTIACPACGPHVEGGDWRTEAHRALRAGEILAVKGIGGFHLVCDAAKEEVAQRLRLRKRRPRKPLAVMARSLADVEACFDLSAIEREALCGARAPIVLLRPRAGGSGLPLAALAPGHRRLGVMLPYSPLHLLLFPEEMPFLVATSGNTSGLPIARTNDEALAQLGHIADRLLLHDREIVVRVEDSVCQAVDGRITLVRRSRGYVPEPVAVPLPSLPAGRAPVVLGAGAEQANTFCLLHQHGATLSQHIGGIDGAEHLQCWNDGISHLAGLLRVEPEVIAYDPHPGFLVSQEATRRFAGKEHIPVYHHHAHMVACMAEHGLQSPAIGCILDGTGYGPDGSLWGFEILAGDYTEFERLGHLQSIALPGGESAIRQPWLLAVSLYHEVAGDVGRTEAWARQFFPQYAGKLPVVLAQLDGRIPAPRASSAGRLFDAVAALLGLCTEISFEGEAAILLGELADDGTAADAYPVVCDDGILQTAPLTRHLISDIGQSVSRGVIARRFHHTVAEMVCRGAVHARERTGLQTVVLGGGVWNNRCLLTAARRLLAREGFRVCAPERVPPGDGGLALGQAVSALWRWSRNVSGGAGESAGSRPGAVAGPG